MAVNMVERFMFPFVVDGLDHQTHLTEAPASLPAGSLHCIGLAPDFLNLATTKATVPQKEPFSQWFKFLVFCPSRDNERGLTSWSPQEGLEFSGKKGETTSLWAGGGWGDGGGRWHQGGRQEKLETQVSP